MPQATESTLSRANTTHLAIDGRTIVGLAVPFNRTAKVSDDGKTQYLEEFAPGSFTATIAQRGDKIRAHTQHQTGWLPIGKASHLEETSAGLESHLRVSDTTNGNDVLVRDGVMTGLSIGFRPVKHVTRGNVKVRTEVALSEISVVADPAYVDAQISGIRSRHDLDIDEYVDARVREYFASLQDPAAQVSIAEGDEITDDPRIAQSIRSMQRLRARILFEGIQ
jgi:HK97 family phage prohead protease